MRTRKGESNGISEFSYGSFSRTVELPDGADEDDVTATYDRGILTVSVPLSDGAPAGKRVEVYEIAPLDEDDDDLDEDEDDDDEDEDRSQVQDQPEHDHGV